MKTKTVPCPACRKQVVWEGNAFRPFCSDACKKGDLGKWATEAYRVPVEDESDKDEKPAWVPRVVVPSKDDEE